MSYLSLENVVKTFNKTEVVKKLSLDIQKGNWSPFWGLQAAEKRRLLI